jgi:hypothetical protein
MVKVRVVIIGRKIHMKGGCFRFSGLGAKRNRISRKGKGTDQ